MFLSSAQLMSLKKGCALMSSAPAIDPSRFFTSRSKSCVIRSCTSQQHFTFLQHRTTVCGTISHYLPQINPSTHDAISCRAEHKRRVQKSQIFWDSYLHCPLDAQCAPLTIERTLPNQHRPRVLEGDYLCLEGCFRSTTHHLNVSFVSRLLELESAGQASSK